MKPQPEPVEISGGCVLASVLMVIGFLALLFLLSAHHDATHPAPPRLIEHTDPVSGETFLTAP